MMMDILRVNWPAAEEIITNAVGAEMRLLRGRAGLTREQMVAQMESDIHPQTLASYEQGTRQCTMARFLEICATLRASPPDVLERALERAMVDLLRIDIEVDLNAIIRDRREETASLRRWARKRLDAALDGDGVAVLGRSVVPELAVVLDYTEQEFTSYLLDFLAEPAAV